MKLSIRRPKFPSWFVLAMAVWFSIFSMSGCAANSQLAQTPSTQAPLMPSSKSFSHSGKNVFHSLEKVLYKRGYLVTSRDEHEGILTAEYYTTTPLQEDVLPVQPSGPSAGDVILVILGIVCIVGLIYIIAEAVSSSSDQSSKKNETHHNSDRHEYHNDSNEETKSVAYKYVMKLCTTSLTDTSSQVEAHITKVIVENGTSTSSAAIESSTTLTNIFEALEDELTFVQEH